MSKYETIQTTKTAWFMLKQLGKNSNACLLVVWICIKQPYTDETQSTLCLCTINY